MIVDCKSAIINRQLAIDHLMKPWLFFCILLVGLIFSAGGHIVGGDEETMFRVTQSLLTRGALDITQEEFWLPTSDVPEFLPRQPVRNSALIVTTSAVVGREGRFYSKYGLGQSLLAIPLYLFGRTVSGPAGARFAVSLLNAFVLAGCGWLMVELGQALGYRRATAMWLALAFALTTLAWPYVKTFYSQPAVTFCLLLMVYAALRWEQSPQARWPWLLGAAGFALLLFRLGEAIVFPVLLIYLFLASRRVQRWDWLLPLAVGILAALLITGMYNQARFGSWTNTGYYEAGWNNPFWHGLYGLLFSPGKGVLLYAPLLVVGAAGGLALAQKRLAAAGLFLGLWLTYLVFYAKYDFWTGGFNWGPRFLLPVVPFGLLPVGTILEDGRGRLPVLVFGLFFILGLAAQAPAILVDHSRFLFQQIETGSPRAYDQTVTEVECSPLLNQWPEALDLLRFYSAPEAWRQARQEIDALRAGAAAQVVLNGPDLIEAEFLRRNTLDLWWLRP